ncbi:inositol monophosphatase family protein [candidate division KSB1 bacterium]
MNDSIFTAAGFDAHTLLNDTEHAARAAGKILLNGLDKQYRIDFKGRIDLVTEIDIASQQCIIEDLRRRYPDHIFWAEEAEDQNPVEEPFVWLIDPLDGTTNYTHGYRFFSISIAFIIDKAIAVGVIYDPWGNEMFTAVKGGGAFLNGRPIHVSEEENLDRSLLVTGFPYDIRESAINNVGLFNHLIMKAQAVRRDGSAALDLAYLAAGRFDGFWELKLHPWDMAAGALIIEEAGGKVSRFDGSEFHVNTFDLLATNGKIHGKMISEIASVPGDQW